VAAFKEDLSAAKREVEALQRAQVCNLSLTNWNLLTWLQRKLNYVSVLVDGDGMNVSCLSSPPCMLAAY
jgi:hypothetical protein